MNVSVNDVVLTTPDDGSAAFAAARELLRQRAIVVGLLAEGVSEERAVDQAVEALLAREVVTPSPGEAECRRYYEGHPREFQSGDLVHARHILFQVTEHVNVPEIRQRAEQTLNGLLADPDRFDVLARELSNCPSGQQGGNLGQIGRGDTVPEFEKALFQFGPPGVMRSLVKTRYGFHIVAIDQRIMGKKVPFEIVKDRIAERLRVLVEEKAVRQYVSFLAGQAQIHGVDLAGSDSPLLQ